MVQALQHLALAMPEDGLAPLLRLTALTHLRLKYRLRTPPPPPPVPRHKIAGHMYLTATPLLSLHYLLQPRAAAFTSADIHAATAAAATVTATAMAAAAAPALVAATATALRRWLAPPAEGPPPPPLAPELLPLGHMTQLESLELNGCTAIGESDWPQLLRRLRRLSRLDVRGTSFKHGEALQGKRRLSVIQVGGTGIVDEGALRKAGKLSRSVRIRM